jgi:pimeloyl-ACP methyl ester carboxylesterase
VHPGRFNQASCGGYRYNDAASLLRPWDHSIPMEDKSEWRDPSVARAYVDAAIASDPVSRSQNPPSFRSPCGAMEDSFYLAIGKQLWDASLVTAPTLVVASERDFWSRSEDREHLVADLVHSPKVRVVVIPGATHFVHLDRPDRGRTELLDTIEAFMKNSMTRKCPADHKKVSLACIQRITPDHDSSMDRRERREPKGKRIRLTRTEPACGY